ncbi:MAG: acyloxyacyl hydrolase [Phycisphaeraceae bacterium]
MRIFLLLSLSLAFTRAACGQEAVAPASADPFAQGQWTGSAYASATFSIRDKGDILLTHVGVGYFLWDGVSLNLEGVLGYTDATEPGVSDGLTYGFDVLVRWHFWRGDDWSVYTEGGAGMIWFDDAFPLGGTRQNFTPQAGIGFTYRCFDTCRLMAGVRWHHVSNAAKEGRSSNPGYDGVMIYAGIAFTF